MIEPIKNIKSRRVNKTLHGRSVYRREDVYGHNVFKGYSSPGTGDGIDLFGTAGDDVYAIGDGVITRWQNDVTKKEVIYLEGNNFVAVYAHINYGIEKININVIEGAKLGKIRGDIADPHLHFELWVGGVSISGHSADELRDKLESIFIPDLDFNIKIIGPDGALLCNDAEIINDSVWVKVRSLGEALGYDVVPHIADQGKVYLRTR